MEAKQLNQDLKIGRKSFFVICSILLGVVILVGILTFVIPAGVYQLDSDGSIIADSFSLTKSSTRLPVWRWFTAPAEAVIWGQGNMQTVQIIAILLILGGSFKVLDVSGGLYAVVQVIIQKFYRRRFGLIWIITLLMMLLASCFGLQEELLILFPLFLTFSSAMGWSNLQAVSLILVTTGVGFTTAIFNPFTVGIASTLAGVSILDGIWYRIGIFLLLYVLTCLYLVRMAKRDETSQPPKLPAGETAVSREEAAVNRRRSRQVFTLFLTVLAVIILASVVPAIAELGMGMIFMTLAFILGAGYIGKKELGSLKAVFRHFLSGAKAIAPSVLIILLAFSVKYIADCGNILHTIFYYCHSYIGSQSPYVAVILLYLLVLVVEFFIPSSVAKALLLIPLLTLAPLPGISANIIILAFLFGDGYANVLYPTCGTLVVGLGLAEVSYLQWLRRTALLQVALFLLSACFLLLAVYIGL